MKILEASKCFKLSVFITFFWHARDWFKTNKKSEGWSLMKQ
jgi:hypothetical protein